MDSQQQFLRPAQHPFYVKKPIVIEGNHALDGQGFQSPHGRPSAYSVDLSWYGYGRKKHGDQLSEPGKPYPKNHSLSLRDVFEKAILSGEVAIDSPEEENGAPGFITSSLPRPVKINHSPRRHSPSRHIQPNVHVDTNNYKGSTDYFLDSSSESESDSVDGRHNEGYVDEISSTVSDDMFKSTSEGPSSVPDEDCTHIQPLPNVLDVSGHIQASRSALSGLFKPKFKENASRANNVHRNPIWDHNEVMGSTGRSHRRSEPEILTKLPRTPFPVEGNTNRHSSPVKLEDHISHNKYLPSQVRSSSRRSPRIGRSSPRLGRNRRHMYEDETEFDEIQPASSPNSRLSSPASPDRLPVEQFEMEDPPWVKELQRARRKRRNCRIAIIVPIVILLIVGGIVGTVLGVVLRPKMINPIGNSSSNPETTTSRSAGTTGAVTSQNITLAGQMRITNRQFDNDLTDSSSENYKNLSRDFCGAMDGVFQGDNSGYAGCDVTRFTNGSVIIHFKVRATLAKANDIVTQLKNKTSFGNWTEVKFFNLINLTDPTTTIETTAIYNNTVTSSTTRNITAAGDNTTITNINTTITNINTTITNINTTITNINTTLNGYTTVTQQNNETDWLTADVNDAANRTTRAAFTALGTINTTSAGPTTKRSTTISPSALFPSTTQQTASIWRCQVPYPENNFNYQASRCCVYRNDAHCCMTQSCQNHINSALEYLGNGSREGNYHQVRRKRAAEILPTFGPLKCPNNDQLVPECDLETEVEQYLCCTVQTKSSNKKNWSEKK